jgi:glycolate oxidase
MPFKDLQSAIDTVPEILSLDKLPIGLEFIEKEIIDIVEKYTGKAMPYHEYPAFLMLIMEGDTQDEVLAYFNRVEKICKKYGAVETYVAGSERAKRFLIGSREKFYPALKKFAPMEEIDIVVPRGEIAHFMAKAKEISHKFKIPVIAYGHAGDGNIHLHPLCTGISRVEWQEKLPYLTREIYHTGINFGGAVSGEHGIGIAKKPLLPVQLGSEQMNLLKGIKQVFDPKNILNPGKIFD